MIPEHYREVLQEMCERLPLMLEKEGSADRNKKGHFTSSVSSTYRGIGVIGYLIEKETAFFRSNLVKATQYRAKLFDRFDAGEAIPASYISMFSYQELLDALASNNMDVARAFAAKMGGRERAEKGHGRLFEAAMGYGLKALVAGNDDAALEWFQSLEEACTRKGYVTFSGYVPFLRAIAKRDSEAAEAAFPAMLAGHKRASTGRGFHSDHEDKFIFVWGIGLINLAHSRGMNITFNDPLIPIELITP